MNWYDEERKIIDLHTRAHRQSYDLQLPANRASSRFARVRMSIGVRIESWGRRLQAQTDGRSARAIPTIVTEQNVNGRPC